jgi:nucleoside permease NupC
MAIYISLGIPAHYLLSASLMAIPGALVISKLLFPETRLPLTQGQCAAKRAHQRCEPAGCREPRRDGRLAH